MRIYHAVFNGLSKYATVSGCEQYDYNPTLRIQGLTLPSAVEVHFSLQDSGGTSVTRIGVTKDGVTDVPIPDFIVDGNDSVKDYKAYVFIYLRDNESAWTEYRITMMFDSRPKPEGHTRPDQSSMSELLKQVNTIADDKITKPTVGKVGQAVVIKTVGADGKPMEFEAKEVNGGAVSPQEIESAVGNYLSKNPITETDPTVPQWAKEPTKPTYTANEVGALADTTVIPSKLSEMAEDTTHRTVTDVEKQKWNGKAEKSDIPDVATIVADHDKSPTSHDDIRQDLTLVKQNLNGLGNETTQLKEDFTKLNQGGLVMKDTVIEKNVHDWLNAHPEATTTVKDESITFEKLSNDTQRKVENKKSVKRTGFVTFTADDGYKEDITILEPIFKKHNIPCCIAMESSIINNLAERLDLQNNHRWEFMCHGIDEKTFDTMTDDLLEKNLIQSKTELQKLGFKIKDVVYPSGLASANIKRVCKKYFRAGFMFNGNEKYAVNKGILDSFTIHRVPLGSFTNSGQNTLEYYKSCVDKAKNENGWVIFCMHSASREFDATQQKHLDDVIAYCKNVGVQIGNISDGYELFGNALECGNSFDVVEENTLEDAKRVVVTNDGDINLPIFKIPSFRRTNENLIEDYPLNKISVTETATYNAGFPENVGGTLITSRFENYSYQIWMPYNKNNVYKRIWGGTVWRDWMKISNNHDTDYHHAMKFPISNSWNYNIPINITRHLYISEFREIWEQPVNIQKRFFAIGNISKDRNAPTIIGTTSKGTNIEMFYDGSALFFRLGNAGETDTMYIVVYYK